MSYRDRYSSSDSSRRYSSGSRRDSPPRHRSRRSPSPGPSRSRKEESRDPKTLPESFGRAQESTRPEEDNTNILQRMKTHYQSSPLADLYQCITNEQKMKIWTRNYKEVRGVMTGYIIAFDKHWNIVLRDVDEVYLKPKKSKTPFLREISSSDVFEEMPAKVPRQKKDAAPPPEPPKPKDAEKKRKRRKKAKSTSAKRHVDKLFVRGDNIVMVCPMDELPAEEEEEEEEEEGEAGGKSA